MYRECFALRSTCIPNPDVDLVVFQVDKSKVSRAGNRPPVISVLGVTSLYCSLLWQKLIDRPKFESSEPRQPHGEDRREED